MVVDWQNRQILALAGIASDLAHRGWCPATGGNFSVNLGDNLYGITASGIDKTNLQTEDFLVVDCQGAVISGNKQPSAETLLHTALYNLDESIAAVLHVHTVADTVLSMCCQDDYLAFEGYEMQKALRGIKTHEARVTLHILDNNQDISLLSQILASQWQQKTFNYGFLVRGHGLYAWGNSLPEAKRHLEGIEFLLNCELQKKLIGYIDNQ